MNRKNVLKKAPNGTNLPEGCEVAALNFQLPNDGTVPEWVELLPAGVKIQGRDGRWWINDNPDGVVTALKGDERAVPIDFEHSTELKAPKGEEAPAAAWLDDFEVREGGSVWGRSEWTPRGRAAVVNREYRYLSPVIVYEKLTGRVTSIASVGLVNQPNLRLQALNRQQTERNKGMDWKQLLIKLGLPEDATLEQALNALGKLQGDLATAMNRADNPSLEKFVPRADYDQALARATNAEQKLATHEKEEQDKAIDTEIDAALKAGKITPGTKDYYTAQCRQEGGLDAFKKFVETAPVIGDPSSLEGKDPNGQTGKALNAEEKKIAEMFGNTAEDLQKYGQ